MTLYRNWTFPFIILMLVACGGADNDPIPEPGIELASIKVQPSTAQIGISSTGQFAAIGSYTDGSTKDITNQVTWISANTTVATVSNDEGSIGVVTGIAVGTVGISAEDSDANVNSADTSQSAVVTIAN